MAIGKRYIDGDKLIEKLEGRTPRASLVPAAVKGIIDRWLRRQPKAPKLVSRQGAAEILGVSSPHVSRLPMPPGITIEGSSRPVYDLEAVEALAAALKAERKTKD